MAENILKNTVLRKMRLKFQRDEDENEFIQMYGQYASRDSKTETAQPDLTGITHMLRMVNEYYDSAPYDDNENIKQLKKAANTVVSLSKLNPNVQEFVSKNVKISVSETKNVKNVDSNKLECSDSLRISASGSRDFEIKHLDCRTNDIRDKTDASHKNETNNKDIDVTKKIDVSSLNPHDIVDIREKLKLKIVGTSKGECLKKKRERNLAMASLLRLYTDIPKSSKNDLPHRLITPEYFQSLQEDVLSNSVVTEVEQNVIKEDIKNEPMDKDIKHALNTTYPANESLSSHNTSSKESPVNELLSNYKTSPESSDISGIKTFDSNIDSQTNGIVMSKEVEESVKKVDKWLNGPEKKKHKSPTIFFGPVTFKKKETSSVKSSQTPSLLNTDNIDRPSSTQTTESFKPSAYATELSKTYMERSQSRTYQNEDIWTKLERQLREKDKIIKERLLAAQDQNYSLRKVQRSFVGLGVHFYNKVPFPIRDLPLEIFKKRVKSQLVAKGYYPIEEYINDKDAGKEKAPQPVMLE